MATFLGCWQLLASGAEETASELLKTISLMELEVTRKVEVGYYENCPSQSDCIDYLTNFGLFPDHNHSHLWGPAGHGRMLFRRNN